MSDTDKLRVILEHVKIPFTTAHFPQFANTSSILDRLSRQGEIRQLSGKDGWEISSSNKPMKVYVVVSLRSTKLDKKYATQKQQKPLMIDPRAEPWREVYPDLFVLHPPPMSMRTVSFKENGDLE